MILLDIENKGWPPEELLHERLAQILSSVFAHFGFNTLETELSALFTDDARMRELNARWRGVDKPTNVLSFPAFALAPGQAPQQMLGDIVFALETIEREAIEQQKDFLNHLTHLMLHGILHLLGFDHEENDEAERMEALEREILALHAIPDPYQETIGNLK